MFMAPFQIHCPLELHNGNLVSFGDPKAGKTLVLEGHVKGLLCIPLAKLEWIFFSIVFDPSFQACQKSSWFCNMWFEPNEFTVALAFVYPIFHSCLLLKDDSLRERITFLLNMNRCATPTIISKGNINSW